LEENDKKSGWKSEGNGKNTGLKINYVKIKQKTVNHKKNIRSRISSI